MNYHRIAFLLFLILLSLILWSCVDVNNANVPSSINYRSLIRFVNLAGDSPAGGAITVDNSAVGTITYGNATNYLDLPAGSRTLGYAGANQLVNFTTDDQFTVIVHSISETDRFLVLDEGYTFKNNTNDSMAQIRFINSAVGFAPSMIFRQDSLNGTTVAGAVPFAKGQDYITMTPGSYAFFALSNGGYTATINGANSVPAVNTNSNGDGTFSVSYDEGVSYTISIKTYNTGGIRNTFYTAAHFHTGGPTVNGPVVHPINVSGQLVSFPDTQLIPFDTSTHSAGSVSAMSLSANAARDSFQLGYTFTVTADATDTLQVVSTFLSAELHVGSITGPVVRTIATGPFRDTTITDVWSTGDAQPLTPALVDTLLAGRIYVSFKTPRHVNGELSLRLHPDPTTTNTFSGTWSDISEALKDSIVNGEMYVNFHTLADPGGQIRGQLVVDPAIGNYGIASLAAAAYNAATAYTVVAADSGTTFLKVFGLANRRGGSSTTVQQKTIPPQTTVMTKPK